MSARPASGYALIWLAVFTIGPVVFWPAFFWHRRVPCVRWAGSCVPMREPAAFFHYVAWGPMLGWWAALVLGTWAVVRLHDRARRKAG